MGGLRIIVVIPMIVLVGQHLRLSIVPPCGKKSCRIFGLLLQNGLNKLNP